MSDIELKMHDFDAFLLEKKDSFFIEAKVIPNRASFFGDGVFETFLFQNGRIKFGNYHLERARLGCEVLGLAVQDLSSLQHLETFLYNQFGNKELRVRWNIFRQGLGKYSPETSQLTETIFIQPLVRADLVKESGFISTNIRIPKTPWSHCKTLNALVYVMAAKERIEKKKDEVILLNADGYVCEAGSSNLFWVKEGVFYTPSLSSNCIAGVARRVILDYLKSQRIPYLEGEFNTSALLEADHLFTSNVTGISHILQVENKRFEPLNKDFLSELFQ
jgi:4-amino-4-deoxychorismate lyase